MSAQSTPKIPTKRHRAVAAWPVAILLCAGAALGAWAAAPPTPKDDVFSFDMWCLEMRLYPSARCDARRADDLKAYDNYRAAEEQYSDQKTVQEKRDQALKAQLDRDPIDASARQRKEEANVRN